MSEVYTPEELQSLKTTIKKRILVIMGVSGSGKTTVAQGLHEILDWPYQEGDSLHPKANVDKMAAGIPLTDDDRKPWLDLCHKWMEKIYEEHGGGILTCSALKRKYRDQLKAGIEDCVRFVYLKVPEKVLEDRLERRTGHYMPPSLLPSQLSTLEPPQVDEKPIVIDVVQPPKETIEVVLQHLKKEL